MNHWFGVFYFLPNQTHRLNRALSDSWFRYSDSMIILKKFDSDSNHIFESIDKNTTKWVVLIETEAQPRRPRSGRITWGVWGATAPQEGGFGGAIAPGRKIRFCIPKIKGICICLSLDFCGKVWKKYYYTFYICINITTATNLLITYIIYIYNCGTHTLPTRPPPTQFCRYSHFNIDTIFRY